MTTNTGVALAPAASPGHGKISERSHRPCGHWMPWRADNRPATARDERRFVAELHVLADRSAGTTNRPADSYGSEDRHPRSDATALLNALRCGLSAAELFEQAPGLDPVDVLAAYLDLETRRATAADAWDQILADPRIEVLAVWGPRAATLMSPLVGQLLEVSRRRPGRYATAVANHGAAVDEVTRCVAEVEAALDAERSGSHRSVELGRILYDPAGAALTNQPAHLPARVGTLTPSRAATLLGERLEVSFPLAG
jgi:hypothetical protein